MVSLPFQLLPLFFLPDDAFTGNKTCTICRHNEPPAIAGEVSCIRETVIDDPYGPADVADVVFNRCVKQPLQFEHRARRQLRLRPSADESLPGVGGYDDPLPVHLPPKLSSHRPGRAFASFCGLSFVASTFALNSSNGMAVMEPRKRESS